MSIDDYVGKINKLFSTQIKFYKTLKKPIKLKV
jgi:hypothetical protein